MEERHVGKEKRKDASSETSQIKVLEKENARLKLKLAKAEAMLDLQKKAAEIVRLHNDSSENDS